jgi:hypothetical protein
MHSCRHFSEYVTQLSNIALLSTDASIIFTSMFSELRSKNNALSFTFGELVQPHRNWLACCVYSGLPRRRIASWTRSGENSSSIFSSLFVTKINNVCIIYDRSQFNYLSAVPIPRNVLGMDSRGHLPEFGLFGEEGFYFGLVQ